MRQHLTQKPGSASPFGIHDGYEPIRTAGEAGAIDIGRQSPAFPVTPPPQPLSPNSAISSATPFVIPMRRSFTYFPRVTASSASCRWSMGKPTAVC